MVLAGVVLVSASDIVVIYVPLLGAERHIDVHAIGLLLTVRAASSMVARLFYARMVFAFGRWPLMIAGTFFCGLSYAAFAAPLPLWAMHMAIAVMGFSFGLATTLSITIVVDMTSVRRPGHHQLAPHHEQPRRPVRAAVRRRPGRGGGRAARPVPDPRRRDLGAAAAMVWKRPGVTSTAWPSFAGVASCSVTSRAW